MISEPVPPLPLIELDTDSHVHTSLCNHASGAMEEYVQAAVRKGLQKIIFLEHLEANISYFERTWLTEDDFAYYFTEGRRLQEKYAELISIGLGVEVGFNPQAIDILRETLNRYPWDRIGLSYHFFFDGRQHLNMVSRRPQNIEALVAIGAEKVIADYFSALITAVQSLDCHVICHLDAVMRHYPQLRFTPSHRDQIEQLLRLMQDKHIRLEINTSGYVLRNEPYPGDWIVRRAMDLSLGLTAGSDAHRPEQVGRFFDLLPGYLSGIGEPVGPDAADNIKTAT